MSWPGIPKIPGVNLPELTGFTEKREALEDSIEQYYSKAEFSNISEYEKIRLKNMKKNYLMLLSIGLPVAKPDFMKGPRARKKAQIVVEDSESDEEWTPTLERRKSKRTVKIPTPFVMPGSWDPSRANENDNKQKRKRKNDKEKPVKRKKVEKAVMKRTVYPKRSLTVTNYMDLEVPDDDTFLYCEECNKEYDDNCPVHGPLTFVEDSPISCDVKSCNKAEQSAPRCVIIKESHIPGAGRGIWAKEAIPIRSRFGPYVGEITTDTDNARSTGYSWQIYKDGKASHFVDANNPETSNWMRYVNCARTEAEQNLTAFQYRSQVYYRAHKPIQAGQELLVWYGQEYGQELGIRRGCSDQSAPIIVKSVLSGEDRYCCRECPHIEFSTRIQYYRHTRNKHGSVIPPDVINEMLRLSAKQNSSNMINNHNTQVMKLNLKSKSCD